MSRRLFSQIAVTILVVAWATPASAVRIASIVRGVGAGSDKAAGYIAHQMRHALAQEGENEIVDLETSLGSPTHKRAKRAFQVAGEMTQKGRNAYETLDLDPAIEYLNAALNRYERHAAFVTDVTEVANVLMLLGATHILRGEEKTGAKRLAQAIAVHPSVEPDPRIFNPGMRQIFQEAADRLANRPLGTLSVTSNPSYAEVYLDGTFVGVTPMALDKVTEGRHFVRLVKEGYRSRGKIIEVVGQVEAADVWTLKPTDSFEEFDALVEAATPSLPSKTAGDGVGEVFGQLGVMLDADQLMMTEVRLDGERVRLLAVLVDVDHARVIRSARQTFSYESQPDTYERELRDLLQRKFAKEALTESQTETSTASGGLVHAAGGVCYGMPCGKLKTLILVVGVGGGAVLALLGGLLDYLAYVDHGKYRKSPQPSDDTKSLRTSGTAKAIVGDIFLGVGIILAGVGTGLYFLWEPTPTASDVVEQTGSRWGLAVVPLPDGAAVSARVEF